MIAIPQQFLDVIEWIDPEAKGARSAVVIWLTPADNVFGFNINVDPADRLIMAERLREHAAMLESQ